MIHGMIHGMLRRYFLQNSNRGNYWKWKFARGWPREIPGPIFTAAHIKISLQYRHDIQLNNNIHNDRNNGGGDDIEESTPNARYSPV